MDDETMNAICDEAAMNALFAKCLRDDAMLYRLGRVANDHDWDQVRALKTAVVVLAAERKRLLEALAGAQLGPPTLAAPGAR